MKPRNSDALISKSSNPENVAILDIFAMDETLQIATDNGVENYSELGWKAYAGDIDALEEFLLKTIDLPFENAATEGYVSDLLSLARKNGDLKFSHSLRNLSPKQKKSLFGYLRLAVHLGYISTNELEGEFAITLPKI